MVALPLLDVVLSGDAEAGRSEKVAAELVRSALSEIRHIENLDESLATVDTGNPDRQTLALVRGMYEEWARSVDALLDRVAPLERRQGPLPGAELLHDAHGRTRAMLSIPLDRLERDYHIAKTPGIPIQEVRRDLHLGTH